MQMCTWLQWLMTWREEEAHVFKAEVQRVLCLKEKCWNPGLHPPVTPKVNTAEFSTLNEFQCMTFQKQIMGWECSSDLEHFPSMPDALGSISSTAKKQNKNMICVLGVGVWRWICVFMQNNVGTQGCDSSKEISLILNVDFEIYDYICKAEFVL